MTSDCQTVRSKLTDTCKPFLLRYFRAEEFDCKCGCGLGLMDMDFNTVIKLDFARSQTNVPFLLVSAIRCPDHNRDVGGRKNSAHLVGKALDISTTNSRARYEVLHALILAGFKRLGVYPSFIHADTDASKSQRVVWYA